MYDLIVKNGKIILPEGISYGDIAVKDGKIAAIFESGEDFTAAKYIDAAGKMVFPGAIDTHTHLNDPGYEWREDFDHGTGAAAIGGYTTIIDMPLQNEPTTKTGEILKKKAEIVGEKVHVDFCLWGGLVDDSFEHLADMDKEGCVALKSFIGPVSPDYSSLNYGQVLEALEIIEKFDGMAGFHCEDFSMIKWQEQRMLKEGRKDWRAFLDSRPMIAELLATIAVIEMSKITGCRVHICHVSHPEVAKRIKEAQDAGYKVTAETCAHYLTFTEDDVLAKGELFKCAPPLRSKEDLEEMWKYVEEGVFSGISSDHSPCTYDEKYNEILGNKITNVFEAWGGISGIQSCFQAAFSEGCVKRNICPSVLANAMSKLPAKAFGIYGQKGDIRLGFDADLVIVDPDLEWEITADSLNYVNKMSAYVGLKGKGMPVCTIVRGEVVAENGKVVAEKGYGKYVRKIK